MYCFAKNDEFVAHRVLLPFPPASHLVLRALSGGSQIPSLVFVAWSPQFIFSSVNAESFRSLLDAPQCFPSELCVAKKRNQFSVARSHSMHFQLNLRRMCVMLSTT